MKYNNVTISCQIWLDIHCFSLVSRHLPWLSREHCILVQQRLDILVAFTNSVLHWSVPSEFTIMYVSDIQTGLPRHQHCDHFHSICLPMSLFSILAWCIGILSLGALVVLCCYPWQYFPLGMVAWLPCTPDFLRWRSCVVCLSLFWLNLEKFFGLTCMHSYPRRIVVTYGILPDLPCPEYIVFMIWRCGISIQHLVVPAALTLCASLVFLKWFTSCNTVTRAHTVNLCLD